MMQASDSFSELFFSGKRHPYYIVAPPYKRTSAGVVTQHILCHLLNRLGYPAYLIIRPNLCGISGYARYGINPKLVTPLLTPEILLSHFSQGLTPITLYSETMPGNPLHAPLVARYVLYYSGKLGGDSHFAGDECIVAFSHAIAQSLPRVDAVISYPIADPREWIPTPGAPRTGRYYYGEKYLRTFGGTVPDAIAKTAIRITRDQPDSLTRPELIKALQSADCLYIFEDTAMIYEALLAGCIVILVPNAHFTRPLGENETGMHGVALNDSPEEIARARATIGQFPAQYAGWMEKGWQQVQSFAQQTQPLAEKTLYRKPLRVFIRSNLWWIATGIVPDRVMMNAITLWRYIYVIPVAIRMFGIKGVLKKLCARVCKRH